MPSHSYRLKTLLVVLMAQIFISCISIADAQVTFSRDWKAGKRAFVGEREGIDCRAFPPLASMCHTLIKELRALATCEAAAVLRLQGVDQPLSLATTREDDPFPPSHSGERR